MKLVVGVKFIFGFEGLVRYDEVVVVDNFVMVRKGVCGRGFFFRMLL